MNVKKIDLVPFYGFLSGVSLVGAASRARTKLNKSIMAAINELQDDEKALAEENNGTVDENGGVNFDEPEDKLSFVKAQADLRDEKVIINETVKEQFASLRNALEQYDKELKDDDAVIYDKLLDVLEEEK
ncbi:hypothetical protein [Leuconostoc falkenbergense]|uniref:hypothetical protein n=1 Tax=Leuconostoc falkenbergense TaxID=2766470 RepID=UPI0024A8FE62|nr:hypothetical protein [Leuconostoc falkenbergense]MDI6553088.1 hypothetical protein [Leuconostoc falkenbergense]